MYPDHRGEAEQRVVVALIGHEQLGFGWSIEARVLRVGNDPGDGQRRPCLAQPDSAPDRIAPGEITPNQAFVDDNRCLTVGEPSSADHTKAEDLFQCRRRRVDHDRRLAGELFGRRWRCALYIQRERQRVAVRGDAGGRHAGLAPQTFEQGPGKRPPPMGLRVLLAGELDSRGQDLLRREPVGIGVHPPGTVQQEPRSGEQHQGQCDLGTCQRRAGPGTGASRSGRASAALQRILRIDPPRRERRCKSGEEDGEDACAEYHREHAPVDAGLG